MAGEGERAHLVYSLFVATWEALGPVPLVAAHVLHCEARLPPQHSFSEVGGSPHGFGVAFSARCELCGDGVAAGLLHRGHHFQDCAAAACADVDWAAPELLL